MTRPKVSPRRQMMAAIVISSGIVFGLYAISEAAAQPAPPVDILEQICGQPTDIAQLVCDLLQTPAIRDGMGGIGGHGHVGISYDGFTTYETAGGAMGGRGVLR